MESDIFTYLNPSPPPEKDGPMAGTTVAIDSNISVFNWPTAAESLALENYVALEDATLIQHLRHAGAVLKGRTAMGELGLGVDNDTCTAVIKNNLSDAVLKTDTTGEVRMAAAASGCFGFKPSYGVISRFGLIGLVPSMETCGILSGSIPTISKTFQTMAALDEKDPSMDESGINTATSKILYREKLQPQSITMGVIRQLRADEETSEKKEFEQTLIKLEKAGVRIKEIDIKSLPLARTVHNVIGTVEASSSAGRFDSVRYGHRTSTAVKNWNDMYIKSRGESFGPLVKAYLFQGGYFQYRKYGAFLDACRIRAALIKAMENAFEAIDLIALPLYYGNKTIPPVKTESITELYNTFSLTLLANLTGNPSISIPGVTDEDSPFPLQLIGKRFDDAHLLNLAACISNIHTGDI